MDVSAHLDLLGRRVADRVTGIEGVVTSVSYDLYGCVQALVVPPASADKARVEWYDVGRLKTLSAGATRAITSSASTPAACSA